MAAYQIGLYEKATPPRLTWRDRMKEARTAGFDFIELSIDETDERLARLDWSAQIKGELRNFSVDTGVPFGSICLSGHRKYPLGSGDPRVYARSLEIMEKSLILACDLGIRYIQLAGYDVYYEDSSPDTVERFRENLCKSVEMATRYGVVLGFETMETPFMDTVQKAMMYVGAVDSPYLGIYPDLGNLTNAALSYNVPVPADLRKGAGHIIAAHIKETRPGEYRNVPFGTGHVDFPAVIGACWELGVRRYVTELWYQGNGTWQEDIHEAAELAHEILGPLSKEDDYAG